MLGDLEVTPHLCSPGETLDHMLLRFLRARAFDVDKALDLLVNDIKWREENQVCATHLSIDCGLGLEAQRHTS